MFKITQQAGSPQGHMHSTSRGTFIKDLLCTKNVGEDDSKEEGPFFSVSIKYYSVQ